MWLGHGRSISASSAQRARRGEGGEGAAAPTGPQRVRPARLLPRVSNWCDQRLARIHDRLSQVVIVKDLLKALYAALSIIQPVIQPVFSPVATLVATLVVARACGAIASFQTV